MKLNIDFTKSFVDLNINQMQEKVTNIHNMIHNNKESSPYLGWVELPNNISNELIEDINLTAKNIRKNSEVLVIIGVGGSYIGSKAGLDFLNKPFKNNDIEILYAGHNISGRYLSGLIKYLEDKDFSINVISKSGTTTEPAIAFRLLKDLLISKYSKDYYKRIIATTDASKGSLYNLSIEEGFKMYVIPDNIGGRFSVLTPVGLLSFAVAGYDINEMLSGAKDVYNNSKEANILNNDAYMYAVIRYLLYKSGKKIELLVNYEPNLISFSEWWKQLFSESEGKDLKGLFAASANYSTDLHSFGQYIQDGERHLFETVLKINSIKEDVTIKHQDNNMDDLNYLENKTLNYINSKSLEGTVLAHVDGLVPNIIIEVADISERSFGKLVYFFELACAMSAYLLGVNPFDQPGVEKYKQNMFSLLGKKGYEDIIK